MSDPVLRPRQIITATAPIRICDNGGWTDTWMAGHGAVFNIAVRPLVTARLVVFDRGALAARVVLDVANFGERYAPALADGEPWGPHPLLEAALRAIDLPDSVDVEATIVSDAPPGASTGTSAAVVVALLGALSRLSGTRRAARAIAREAHAVETVRLERQCGVQDQLCAALGGVNFIEITAYPEAVVSRLRLGPAMRQALGARLALVYLGRPHSSSAVHERVMADLARRGSGWAPLESLRRAARQARDAVLADDVEMLGRAMRANTEAQAALDDGLVNPAARRVIEIAGAHGAAGWKVNGAGGDGGSLSLLGPERPVARRAMMTALASEDAAWRDIPVALSRRGLHVRTQAAPGP